MRNVYTVFSLKKQTFLFMLVSEEIILAKILVTFASYIYNGKITFIMKTYYFCPSFH